MELSAEFPYPVVLAASGNVNAVGVFGICVLSVTPYFKFYFFKSHYGH